MSRIADMDIECEGCGDQFTDGTLYDTEAGEQYCAGCYVAILHKACEQMALALTIEKSGSGGLPIWIRRLLPPRRDWLKQTDLTPDGVNAMTTGYRHASGWLDSTPRAWYRVEGETQ